MFLIWSQKPCHNCAAVIGSFRIHHGSFHALKPRELLNDEVASYVYACMKTTLVVILLSCR